MLPSLECLAILLGLHPPLLQVTDSQDLQTVWRQQVCERSWHSLAQHFAILLSDQDSEQLLAVQEHAIAWKEAVSEFAESQQSLETQLHAEVRHT